MLRLLWAFLFLFVSVCSASAQTLLSYSNDDEYPIQASTDQFQAGFDFFRTPAEGVYVFHWTSALKDDSVEEARKLVQDFVGGVDPSQPKYKLVQGDDNMGNGLYTAANPFRSREFGEQLVIVRLRPEIDFARTWKAYAKPDNSAANLLKSRVAGILL